MNGNLYRPSMLTLVATLVTMDAPELSVGGHTLMSGAPRFGRARIPPHALRPIDTEALEAARLKRLKRMAKRAATA